MGKMGRVVVVVIVAVSDVIVVVAIVVVIVAVIVVVVKSKWSVIFCFKPIKSSLVYQVFGVRFLQHVDLKCKAKQSYRS